MLPKYKDIVDLLKKGSTIEAQEKIMSLREGALDLQEENQDLKEQIKKLQSEMSLKNSVVYDNSCYWLEDNEGRDGPFCQRCFDVDKMLVRLQGGNNELWECKECDKEFCGKNYVTPSFNIPIRR